MKRFLAFFIVMMCLVCHVDAQRSYYDSRYDYGLNEFSIGYGLFSLSDISNSVCNTFTNGDDAKYSGIINAEFFHYVMPWFSLGAIVGYEWSNTDCAQYIGNSTRATSSDKIHNNYFTIMPAAKYCWFDGRSFCMYSKVGIGTTINFASYHGEHDKCIRFAGQFTPIGMEIGSVNTRFFFEGGIGSQGIVNMGVRFRFSDSMGSRRGNSSSGGNRRTSIRR